MSSDDDKHDVNEDKRPSDQPSAGGNGDSGQQQAETSGDEQSGAETATEDVEET